MSRQLAPREGVARWFTCLRDRVILTRLAWCFAAALTMWLLTGGWAPGFSYRTGYVPPRDITARVRFQVPDEKETEARRRQARSEVLCIYQHDERALVELRKALKNQVFQVIGVDRFELVDLKVWRDFLPPGMDAGGDESRQRWQSLKTALAPDMELAQFEKAVQLALADYERDGLLENLTHGLEEGSQTAIWVHPLGNPTFLHRVEVKDVRIAEATSDLDQRVQEGFEAAKVPIESIPLLVNVTTSWLRAKKLPSTLTLNREASEAARREAEQAVEEVYFTYNVGDRLAAGGAPLRPSDLTLLHREYDAMLETMTWRQKLARSLAEFGMYIAMYVLCGTYIYYHERRLIEDPRRLLTFLAFVVMTVGLAVAASRDSWRAETIPLTLFALTVAIAYQRDLALICGAAVALVVVMTLSYDLAEFILLVASASAPTLLVRRVRNRTRLIYIGLAAGVMVLLTAIGVGTMMGQSFGSPNITLPWMALYPVGSTPGFASLLIAGATWLGFCSVLSGLLMTGLLPFIERLFDVQTDLSLLELGDPAHPLLQELARRAPGTYNHSINVASLAEAAAEAIGGNGLLVRVGAYFHDIGKMAKPQYFVENQGQAPSRHDSLLPAMSTLVIISHVKDGAELAKRHHLPRSIIDFIEQHHGTTLVEYFYGQAAKLSASDPDRGEVDETSFRYPGPKPQTKEAAVMMVADAVESASRTLIEPAPARIESLVHEIAMKRLLDGQFDECGLTLRELSIIEDSLVKSITAVYHSRVKYPDQQTA